ncbi:hypothetical protein BDD12DRAFT_852011 [Trichophaea hybrida]|nr:hypothetical protein BDD12DRAFT_852011 [Trichophaea hybrida]
MNHKTFHRRPGSFAATLAMVLFTTSAMHNCCQERKAPAKAVIIRIKCYVTFLACIPSNDLCLIKTATPGSSKL